MNDIEDAFRRARAERFGADPSAPSLMNAHAATLSAPWPFDLPLSAPASQAGQAPDAPIRDARDDTPPPLALSPALHARVVTAPGAAPASMEQYRKLAALLHDQQRHRGIRTVMIASAVGREGKSLTTLNLALTLTRSYGRQVLVIDADLRRPSLQEMLGVGRCDGLNETIPAGRVPAPVELAGGLSLIAGGQPNSDPMRILTSPTVRTLIEQAAARYDWVLIDTPPLTVVPDAHLIVDLVDTAVLVVSAGRTSFARVQRAVTAIGRERLLGVVLNGVANGHLLEAGGYGYYEGY